MFKEQNHYKINSEYLNKSINHNNLSLKFESRYCESKSYTKTFTHFCYWFIDHKHKTVLIFFI